MAFVLYHRHGRGNGDCNGGSRFLANGPSRAPGQGDGARGLEVSVVRSALCPIFFPAANIDARTPNFGVMLGRDGSRMPEGSFGSSLVIIPGHHSHCTAIAAQT